MVNKNNKKNNKKNESNNKSDDKSKQENKKLSDISIDEKLVFDDRISSHMIELYKKSCIEFKNATIHDPIYILDNLDKCKLFYINYNQKLLNSINIDINIDDINKNDLNKLLNNSYSEYMNHMLNMNIYE